MVLSTNAADWPSEMNLSFSGCGFMCVYHVGVCAAIKVYWVQEVLIEAGVLVGVRGISRDDA